ncbi:hypothetical protein ONZ45_g10255 [Pleurotus djamor]|nr:hypothetical protein ONZ45_g10255 [Pleurotus djamor]
MSLPPILYHYFRTPLPYAQTLALQERLHQIQLLQRKRVPSAHSDLLLLLQHRPVYTGGRRQTSDETSADRERLTQLGADYQLIQRGGETTYHGPGQVVGYPLLDLSRYSPAMGIRDYICRMQKTMENHFVERHGVQHVPSDHTGVFLDEHTKIASIGVQVRHRLTNHGFAFNVTNEPLAWFNQVVACGLVDVKAGSLEGATGKSIKVEDEIPPLVAMFGKMYGREMAPLDPRLDEEVGREILALEEEAEKLGAWKTSPS